LSEASSGSSDEVIFQGRGNTSAPLSTTVSRVETPLSQKQVAAVAEAVSDAVDETKEKAEVVATQLAESTSIPVEVQPKLNVSIRVKGIVMAYLALVSILLTLQRATIYRIHRSSRTWSGRRVRRRHRYRQFLREASRKQACMGRYHNTLGTQVKARCWMAARRGSSRHGRAPG
jgi:hypothetical protein